ncbi:MAG: Nramp family divalent metal transporter [Pseudonocardiales bacterium]|nr:Nramp family divalent metal transporter [Pseudonocardiales bacterium]
MGTSLPSPETALAGANRTAGPRPGRRTPRRWRARLLAVLAVTGPGLVAAAAGNDAGGIATYASAGAQFGYHTLFLMVFITVILALVQEMCARLGCYTGEGLGSLFREQFSLRVTAVVLVAFLVANLGAMVSEFGGVGVAFELVGVGRFVSVPIAAVIIWALVVFGSYRHAERVFLGLALVFLVYPVAAILAHPNVGEVLSQTLLPSVVPSGEFLLLSVGLVGATISPYVQFYVASAVADKGVRPLDYPRQRTDAILGAVFANVINMFIIIAAAAAITTRAPLQSAQDAGQALRPVAGPFAAELFAIGLLGASALAAAVVPLSTAYVVSEAIGTERSVGNSFREAPLFLWLFTGQIVVGATIALLPGNLINLLIRTQILNGVIAPILLTCILVLTNRRALLGPAANGPVLRALGSVFVGIIAVMAVAAMGLSVAGWFGVGG